MKCSDLKLYEIQWIISEGPENGHLELTKPRSSVATVQLNYPDFKDKGTWHPQCAGLDIANQLAQP
jgi:hypothetical protein